MTDTVGAEVGPTPLDHIRSRGRARTWMTMLGPAFVASVAYVDPGNFASNFAAGSEYGYRLVWVLLTANAAAVLVQYCSAKLGIATSRSLPELCRGRYRRRTNALLWLQGELVAMSTDVAEFVGAAVGLNLLFGIPLPVAGVLTGIAAFGILGLRERGYRGFELVIAGLLVFVACGFAYQLFAVGNQNPGGFVAGLRPRLGDSGQATLMVAIIGATVMPHVIYLHSALMVDRVTPMSDRERRTLMRFSRYDCFLGLGLAGLTNLSMLAVAAALFAPRAALPGGLHEIFDQMHTTAGPLTAAAFGVALAASGFASSSVGTYAGQVVMSGFMNWRIPLLVRRAVTMTPSVVLLCFAHAPEGALVLSQVVLSFGIPFALVPLTVLTSDRAVMGPLVNRRSAAAAMWLITVVISALNAYLVVALVNE